MNKKLAVSSLAVALFVTLVSPRFVGQRQRTATNAPPNITNYLPASDAIAIIDVKRLLNETMPSILGSDPAKLAQADAEVEKFKARTGIDPRSFDRVVLGARFTYPAANTTRLENGSVARRAIRSNTMNR